MPASAHLETLLRALQVYSPLQDTPRLLSSAAYLLTILSNPLNISLLTLQTLHAPALWTGQEDLRYCLRVMASFQAAAAELVKRKDSANQSAIEKQAASGPPNAQTLQQTMLNRHEWLEAVLKGASGNGITTPWKQVLVLGGLLAGFEGNGKAGLARRDKRMLLAGLIAQINAAAVIADRQDSITGSVTILVLNYTFELLEEGDRTALDWNHLLPVLLHASFFSGDGYRGGYFLADVDQDVRQISQAQFGWSDRSPSYMHFSDMAAGPLVTSMGPLSRIIAYGVEHCRDTSTIQNVVADLATFSSILLDQWCQIKLSEVDVSEEQLYLNESTMTKTLPHLWKVLRSCLFAVVIMLTAVMSRVLRDSKLAADSTAPHLATLTLQTLRSLYFITTRVSSSSASFTQHTFVHLAAIDILTYHPSAAADFLRAAHPFSLSSVEAGNGIPLHPLDRTLTLYYLNTAEHFTLMLPPDLASPLLLTAAQPYLQPPSHQHLQPPAAASSPSPGYTPTPPGQHPLHDLLEAAHSTTLAVLSSPQNAHLLPSHLPNYVNTLFAVFPAALTEAQFQFGVRTVLGVAVAGEYGVVERTDGRAGESEGARKGKSAVVLGMDGMTETVMELLLSRIHSSREAGEHTALLTTLITTLPLLPLPLLQHYLPLTASLLADLPDGSAEKIAGREKLWQVLSGGEMDVERSQWVVWWWGTGGGREVVLGEGGGERQGRYMMSGALGGWESKM